MDPESLVREGVAAFHQADLRLVAALIFIGSWLAGRLAHRAILRLAGRIEDGRGAAARMLAQIAKTGIYAVGFVTALGTAGVDISGLVAGLGLTGFALGFALRDALSNLVAGVLLLFYRPFRRGDRVEVAGYAGTVLEMDLRYTRLQGEGRDILVPNSVIFNSAVTIFR